MVFHWYDKFEFTYVTYENGSLIMLGTAFILLLALRTPKNHNFMTISIFLYLCYCCFQ